MPLSFPMLTLTLPRINVNRSHADEDLSLGRHGLGDVLECGMGGGREGE